MATPALEPNVVKVYAVQTTRTMEDHVTRQGFGYSSHLETPQTSVTYIWKTKLHGQRPDVVSNSNCRDSLDELAQNLAMNLQAHQSQPHNQARTAAYRISYDVETKEEGSYSSKSIARPLTTSEQTLFIEALQRALGR